MISLAVALTLHTNFTGEVEADSSADSQACSEGQRTVIDAGNVMYIYNDSGVVHRFDATTGALLGTLGTFTQGRLGTMRILNHPTRGTWLVVSSGTVWGQLFQLMAIVAVDGGGSPLAPGTVTNSLGTMNGGIFAGGNSGDWDVDSAGNIWNFGADFGGVNAWQQLLSKVSFSGDTVISATVTNMGTVHGWAAAAGAARGVRFDPVSGNLVLWGKDGSSTDIAARMDQNAAFAILASSTTLPVFGPPLDSIGVNGQYVVSGSPTLVRIQVSDFSVLQTQNGSTDYGLSTPLHSVAYDPLHSRVWVFNGPSGQHLWVIDLNNPTPEGTAQLLDPNNGMADPGRVSTGAFALSPNGALVATEFQGGAGDTGTASGIGFIDFGAVGVGSKYYWGHGLNLLSSYPTVN